MPPRVGEEENMVIFLVVGSVALAGAIVLLFLTLRNF